MRRAASALLAATVLLASCTSQPSPTPPASIPPGLEPIAAAYLTLVEQSNKATCTFNAALSQSAPTLSDLQRASAAYAKSVANLIDGLRALDWPADIADDAQALAAALANNEGHTRAMAAADTMSTFITADNQLIEANKLSAVAATLLRADLGLGSAGVPCSTE
jgi:hypothetical protein